MYSVQRHDDTSLKPIERYVSQSTAAAAAHCSWQHGRRTQPLQPPLWLGERNAVTEDYFFVPVSRRPLQMALETF